MRAPAAPEARFQRSRAFFAEYSAVFQLIPLELGMRRRGAEGKSPAKTENARITPAPRVFVSTERFALALGLSSDYLLGLTNRAEPYPPCGVPPCLRPTKTSAPPTKSGG